MVNSHEEKIIQSWNENAGLWASAVRSNALESRHLVTNNAIVNTVMSCNGSRILDVGCGEGWLSHALITQGKDVTGFDVSSELIAHARTGSAFQTDAWFRNPTQANTARFHIISYEQFAASPHVVGTDFDVVVCNFSLLGDQIKEILKAMLDVTTPYGHLVIQTLHPYSSAGELRYEDGWREEHFNGLAGQWTPMPWYFRTMTSWIRELTSAGWKLNALKEPLHPVTGRPASLILHGMKRS